MSTPPVGPPDTITWGVRWNQHHPAPPLPPRPSGAKEQLYSHLQPSQLSQDSTGRFSPTQIPAVRPPASFHQQTRTVPPLPPKILQGQTAPAEQYYQTTRLPLPYQGTSSATLTGSGEFRSRVTDTNALSTGSSALGPGTPSDWEHLNPSPGSFGDAGWLQSRQPALPPQPSPAQSFGSKPSVPVSDVFAAHCRSRTDTNNTLSSAISGVTNWGHSISDSPVSPCTSQSMSISPNLDRVNSADPNIHVSMVGRENTIDNVMDAWDGPLPFALDSTARQHEASIAQSQSPGPPNQPSSNMRTQSVPVNPPAAEIIPSPPHIPQFMERPESAVPIRAPDPFEDLDPWSKSSLERYVAMLRKEAVADLDEERYKIFTAFMNKEAKLREILYSIGPEPEVPRSHPQALEPPARSLSASLQPQKLVDSGLLPVEANESSQATQAEGHDCDDVSSEYSAGGRPIFAGRQSSQFSLKVSTLPLAAGPTPGLSRKSSVIEPLTTNPPRPIYTPFHYTEGPQRGSDNLKFDRPAYQAYSDLRQAASNGRVLSNGQTLTSPSESNFTSASPALNERDETFLGLIRHKSDAYTMPAERNPTPLSLVPEALRHTRPGSLVEDLRAMVWKPLNMQSESSWHITTRKGLEKFTDDFSYIQQTVDRWKEVAASRREKVDNERVTRQEESEQNIDDLFNAKAIGYADINTLEEEFRQTEARVQLEEERHEIEHFFLTQVFNPLDERLNEEISALRTSYDSAFHRLDGAKELTGSEREQLSPSVTMKMVNEIHQKLESRFQQRLDLALDCERRRKKAERRPLVYMGDMAGLRKLDAEFDEMERRNILEACKDLDSRANRLMDSFDNATLHGLGANQSLMDEVASKIARLDNGALRASGLSDSQIEQILRSATTFAASLLADSEEILRQSMIADMALNDADYRVSVAEARYVASDPEIFSRLADEKKKEDDKMQSELESKLESIQRAPKKIETLVEQLLHGLKNSSPGEARYSPAQTSAQTTPSGDVPLRFSPRPPSAAPVLPSINPGSTPHADLEHQERLRRALEEAKKRNAARNH